MEIPLSGKTPPIDAMAPDHLATAVFALGNFRDAEARLGLVKGVWRTCVGYVGGTSSSPCQNNVGDHYEGVLVEYAPQTLSYGQLLEILMSWHDNSSFAGCNDVGSAFFYQTAREQRLAQAAIERNALLSGFRVHLLPFKTFHRAENDCQKYYLRAVSWLYDDLMALCGGEEALIRSTLAARLNGFLRKPSRSALRCLPESADLYGLSPRDRQALIELAG